MEGYTRDRTLTFAMNNTIHFGEQTETVDLSIVHDYTLVFIMREKKKQKYQM